MKRHVWLLALALGSAPLMAQDWEIDGNNGMHPINNYVGNNDNVHLNFRTDSLFRMRLWNTEDNIVLNTFNIERHGFLGISQHPSFFTNGPGAFTRLHLVDSVDNNPTTYAQDFGFRPWMRNGVTMTGNSDQMYIGHKYTYVDSTDYESGEINDRSDAVIEWSDNPEDSPWGTDRLRFMFTNDFNVAAPPTFGAQSLEGMEAMRIFIPNDFEAHVGIGDFFRAGVLTGQNEDPTERLHVRDGRVRIQQLPDDAPADSDFVVMVVDTTALPSGERGVVKWVPASAVVSAADCEWSMTGGAGAGVNDVWTATGVLVDGCPDQTESVGIGTSSPSANAKLHVYTNSFADAVYVRQESAGANVVGARLEVTAGTGTNAGLSTQVSAPGTQNWGALLTAYGASGTNYGAQVIGGGGGTNSIGVAASAGGGSASNTAITGGVSSASPRNVGDRITVSGGTVFNVGDSILVSGAAANNRGIVVSTTGASASNTAITGTVNSGGASNLGMGLTATGSTTANTGSSINVFGTSAANTGLLIRTNDGGPSNQAITTNTSSTGANVTNYGLYHRGTTGSETSQNRGVQIELSGAADKVRGVEVISNCTNSGTSTNATQYAGHFICQGTGFKDAFGVIGDANGATSGTGRNRGVLGRAMGSAPYNTGVCGTSGTSQPLDRSGGFGVYGQNRPVENVNVGTAGYVDDLGMIFPRITGRTGVAGVCRPAHDGFNAGTLGYVGPADPGSWPNGTFGIYGRSQDTSWAGYFQGNVNVNGNIYLNGVYFASDENLKENIEELPATVASEAIAGLDPVSYTFSQEAQDQLSLPAGEHVGLIAQQVQQVLPHLVKEKTQPAQVDTLGNVVHEEMSILTVDYVGLVPYLIADNQRLQARLDQLAGQVASCCAAGTDQRAMQASGASLLETDLRIIPNPVADQTELRYTVAEEGAVRLAITDASGRTIQVQDEGTRSTGTFSYGWDTTSLAAGTYYCTLYVNDEPLVKKAVKLNVR